MRVLWRRVRHDVTLHLNSRQEIKGKADAEATSIYADAYNRNPEFYSFMKTLDVYKDTLNKDTSVVLSTDSDFFRYLKESKRN